MFRDGIADSGFECQMMRLKMTQLPNMSSEIVAQNSAVL